MGADVVKKILVIEQQTHTRNLFLKGLKAKGFYTISADNGRVGIHLAQEDLPDVIISGIMMSELDGYDVLTAVRSNPVTAIIPFIFVTAKLTRNDLRKAMELGADDYLTKPCTLEELHKAIAAQLEKQTVLRQLYSQPSPPVPAASSTETATITITTAADLTFPSNPPLSEVFRFIEANYHRAIALGDVAQAVGYSPAYLTNLTRRQTGQTVQRWIIQRRMAAARSLLLETDQAVEHIAPKVGYHNAVHFFRQFRQFHGTTPQAWRNTNRS
ncbi:DNA-binding response regulator [Trichocoleus sp. FACHB-90]|uniref:response regulator transcription factor n=1 Tax=Cyanophyceae TaxID=3028117 RepID=UPI0016878DC9|nr:DNA-binding response regulator [Trichocoleus sp. FACHB-90]MBD1926372.1 DNA-binding response regulator [Trichocoleus sp. FACHB-90]